MSTQRSATLPPADSPEGEAELSDLRDQVALLRDSAESRWQEIAALTRMVQTLEAEKIESRSAYDRERRMLEGEIAELRRMVKKASSKKEVPVKIERELPITDDDDWEQRYHQVINSTSWRITHPLRVVVDRLRGNRG